MEYLHRIIKPLVTESLKPNKVVVLLGPRRVGKTVLINQILEEITEPFLFLNGEDISTRELFSRRSVENFMQLLEGNLLLVIDEAWQMMKSEDAASFLFGMAKRGRKYYLGLSTITQDVNDFLKSQYGLAIITNSSIQFLLKQSPTTIDIIQKTFNLTDEEKYLLLESNVGEGIFFAGLKHVAIKIIASYTEDQIITSDPSQILLIKKAKRELEMSSQ